MALISHVLQRQGAFASGKQMFGVVTMA
jgi:hypothetical protein